MRCDEIWVCLLLLSAITAGIYWSLPHNVLRVITVNRRRQYEIWFMKMCDVMRCDEIWVCLLLLSAITAGIYWSLPHNVLRVITVNLQRELVLWWSYAAIKCVLEWVYGYIVLIVIPLFECGRSVIILNNSNQYIYNKLSRPIRFSSRDWISCLYKQLIQSLEENRIGQRPLLVDRLCQNAHLSHHMKIYQYKFNIWY
jgi:hypothetical protein